MATSTSPDGTLFFEQISSYLSHEACCRVRDAFDLARQEHGDQRRKSGELFFTHPLTVAHYLADYMLDAPAIIAALLHDVAEDTKVSIEDIETRFGKDVSKLVNSVTKLKDVKKGVAENTRLTAKEVEDITLHKLLAVMVTDMSAVIIKLFDRLHNMRTIRAIPHQRQVYKASETLSVYAPLADRLGIWTLKNELEALSLEVLDNTAYTIIKHQREKIEQEQQAFFQLVSGQIFNNLLAVGIDIRDVYLAPENTYTTYQDARENGISFYNIDQTMRLVIVLADWLPCYEALGHLHQLWKPVPHQFDDYIAYPRQNLYRSLHTMVVHNNGRYLKLRLRSIAMDKVSEIGVLARWLYKGTEWSKEKGIDSRIGTFFDNINENINVEPQNPAAGVKGVVEDVFRQQIHVYTPNGDVIDLVKGATPVDFAYAIHTGLGDQCQSASINGTVVPLNKPLQNGDQVRIIKRLHAQPRRSWLDENLGYIVTHYARTHARRWFRRLSTSESISQGKQLCQNELDMLGLSTYSHEQIAAFFDYNAVDSLYYDIGRAELLPTVVATRVVEDKWGKRTARHLDNIVYSSRGEKFVVHHADNRKLRLCGTCEPRPPEPIIGFIRKNGNVTIHKERCHKLHPDQMAGRTLKLMWGNASTHKAHIVTIQIKVYDRPGLLFEITELMQNEQINISFINTPPAPNGEVYLVLTLEIVQPRHLVRILHRVKAMSNVHEVRTMHLTEVPDHDIDAKSLYRPE